MPTFKRSSMTLFSGSIDIASHQVRVVLAEKSVAVDIIEVDVTEPPEDYLDLDLNSELPVLVDRDLVLYKPTIIMDYLDSRFPHPPLLSVYPVLRSKAWLMMHRIQEDLYSQMYIIQKDSRSAADAARQTLRDHLVKISPVFQRMSYFFSNDFTMVDCYVAPLFWRLPSLGVELPDHLRPLLDYMDRLFSRTSFEVSLTDAERELREEVLV